MSAVLAFEGLAKDCYGVPAVRDLTLGVEEGGALGLIGENGAGKSTLMNLVGGVVTPSAGSMRWRGEVYALGSPADATARGIAFIHQELNLFTNLSIAENVFIDGFPRRLGLIDRKRIAEVTRDLIDRLNLDHAPETAVGDLAPGERQLVEIAKALHRSADLIIFDEPTTSLTPRETGRLFDVIDRLKAEGRTIIYISHILGDVERVCDRIAVLRDGALVDEGATADFPVASMIRSMIGRELSGLFPDRTASPSDTVVFRAEGLTQPGVLENVSLEIRSGKILGLFGLMGLGRSEFARAAFGLDAVETGSVMIDGAPVDGDARARIAAGLAFVTENRGFGAFLTGSQQFDFEPAMREFGLASIAGGPVPVIFFAILAAGAHVVLSRTTFGRQVYAIGNDPEAARKAGLPVASVRFRVYVISGACAGLAGFVMISQIGRLDAGFGEGREFDVIAAAVLGGASLFGGIGSAFGAVFGATLIQTVKTGLVFTGLNLYLQPILMAAIILLAVLIDPLRVHRLQLRKRRTIRPVAT